MAIRLVLDTSKTRFTVARPAEEKRDQNGVQRKDRVTQLPLWTVELIARYEGGADVIKVTVADINKPNVTDDANVSVIGLEAVPWVKSGSSSANIAFRAEKITPAGKAA